MTTKWDGESLIYTRPRRKGEAAAGELAPPARPVQQALDYSSRLNERLAIIRSLELPLAELLTPDQASNVIDLLVRVAIAAGRSDDGLTSHARVCYLGAGIDGCRTVSERTIRTWRSIAEELGLLAVDPRSHRFGRSYTNVWQIAWPQVLKLARREIAPAELWRKRGGSSFRPGAEAASAPYKPDQKDQQETTTTSPPRLPPPRAPSATEQPGTWQPSEVEAVEVELIRCGISETKLREILSRRQRIGESPSGFLSRLAVGQRTIRVPVNAEKFRSPVGALVCFLATGNWPALGIVAPERADAAAAKCQRQAARKEWELVAHQVMRQANRERVDRDEFRRRLLAAVPAAFAEELLR